MQDANSTANRNQGSKGGDFLIGVAEKEGLVGQRIRTPWRALQAGRGVSLQLADCAGYVNVGPLVMQRIIPDKHHWRKPYRR